MNISNIKELAEAVESTLQSIGIIVGAIWVYRKFIRTREDYPKIQFDLDLRVLGRQDKQILIEVTAIVVNKGLVRHVVENFYFDILTLKNNAAVTNGGDKINHQVLLQKHNPSDKKQIPWMPNCKEEQGEKDDYTFVDSGVSQKYTYLSSVPDDTSFVSIHSKFFYKGKEDDWQTAQKTFNLAQP